jgi:IPTL-CTERM motif/WD40-like Beta Propeller Repeat
MNPNGTREYFVFDSNNGVNPIGQFTNDPSAIGSITSDPVADFDGSRMAFVSSENYVPPNMNANGGRELYLADITYNPPNPPASQVFQITNFPNNQFSVGGTAITPDGNYILFGSNASITGMNPDENTDLFLVDVTNPAIPVFTQITKSDVFTASRGIINSPASSIAFITDNPQFTGLNNDSDQIIFADIADPNDPQFIALTNFRFDADIDDLTAPDDFSYIAFESDSNLLGNNADENDEIYILSLQNCGIARAPIPTLSVWGLIAMASILGIVGFMVMKRRKVIA